MSQLDKVLEAAGMAADCKRFMAFALARIHLREALDGFDPSSVVGEWRYDPSPMREWILAEFDTGVLAKVRRETVYEPWELSGSGALITPGEPKRWGILPGAAPKVEK